MENINVPNSWLFKYEMISMVTFLQLLIVLFKTVDFLSFENCVKRRVFCGQMRKNQMR